MNTELIVGLKGFVDRLQRKAAQVQRDQNVSCVVGFTASYALYVHEDLQAYHKVGQAKFLEQPARELQPILVSNVTQALKQGKTWSEAILIAGLLLQRESQKLCPVDTGLLKNSAFTRIDVYAGG